MRMEFFINLVSNNIKKMKNVCILNYATLPYVNNKVTNAKKKS